MEFYKMLMLKLMKDWKYAVLIGLVLVLSAVVGKTYIPNIKEAIKSAMVVTDKEEVSIMKPIVEDVKPPVKEYCEPIKEYIIKTDDILAMGNTIVLNLDTFELFRTKTRGNSVGKYYRRKGSKFEYYTVFEDTTLK